MIRELLKLISAGRDLAKERQFLTFPYPSEKEMLDFGKDKRRQHERRRDRAKGTHAGLMLGLRGI